MSSSTMIHGAVIRRARANRKIAERVTIPASQAATGTARTSASETTRPRARARSTLAIEAGLAEPPAELRSGRASGLDPGFGGRRGDLREHGATHGGTAGGRLEG